MIAIPYSLSLLSIFFFLVLRIKTGDYVVFGCHNIKVFYKKLGVLIVSTYPIPTDYLDTIMLVIGPFYLHLT